MVLSPVFMGVSVFVVYMCFSCNCIFSQDVTFTGFYHPHCARKNYKGCFYEVCSIFFIDLNLNVGLLLYSKCVDVFKMFSVSHLIVKYFQSSLIPFTRCNKIMKH